MSQALPLNTIYSFYSILIRAGRIPCLARLTACPHFARLLEAPVVEEDLAGLGLLLHPHSASLVADDVLDG